MSFLIRFCLPLALAGAGLSAPAATVTEPRAAAGFTSVSLAAPVRVDLVLGDREGVVLEGEAAALARIETVVEGGALHIRLKDRRRWSYEKEVRARVTARRIEALAVAGSGDIHALELRGESLKIGVSGSGDVTVGGGKVASLTASVAGSGDIRAGKLEAQRAKVSVSGSGDVTVWALRALTVSVAGSGDVHFYGDPEVTRSVAGSGDVRRLGAAPS